MDQIQLTFNFILLILLCLLILQATESQEVFCGEEECGDVTIRSPFGINKRCYGDRDSFRVTCNETQSGKKKPYINVNGIDVEVLGVGDGGSLSKDVLLINNPVTYVNCGDKNYQASLNLTATPFYFPIDSYNYFGSIGCGDWATILSNESDSLGGCLQPICGDHGAKEYSGCFISITGDLTLTSYTVKMMNPGSGEDDDGSKRCASAFLFYKEDSQIEYQFPSSTISIPKYVPAALMWDPNFCGAAGCEATGPGPINLHKETLCGDVSFQYPFGISDHQDYPNDWFSVMCKETSDGHGMPSLNINDINLQILSFSFPLGTITVNHSITYFNCHIQKENNIGMSLDLAGTPFYYSDQDNVIWSSGCGNLVIAFNNDTNLIGGCLQPSCRVSNVSSSDAGCPINIPLNMSLTSFSVNMTGCTSRDDSSSDYSRKRSRGFASMVGIDMYLDLTIPPIGFDTSSNRTHASMSLQWGTPMYGLCHLNQGSNTSCSYDATKQYCWSWLSSRHLCVCFKNFSIDYSTECQGANCGNYKHCHTLCLNSPGNYCSSHSCPPEYEYNSTGLRCEHKITSLPVHTTKNWGLIITIIGCSTSLGSILLVIAIWRMYKVFKRRKNAMLKQRYFKRNGGLLLQQHLSSNKGNVEKIKLFTSKEMEKATDFYNENRILGQGGQGTVYKGMLIDGSIVAIKRSKMVEGKRFDERKVEQFINEVIILSQINHRNVVSLLGCCLEAEVPLLVYEFIPNGTLYDLIHHQSEEFPLTWEMRLRIAIEISNALFYLHSAASVPIYHRDIKSSNILLDDKYRAKVSDFGTSRSIALEQTHLTTRVQGTFGYMDPEYFRSSQFTEKSDVYSFGVVLVELLTGQKPISSNQTEEVRSLVSCFLLSMQENSLFDIIDSMVVNHGPEKEIIGVAKLAKRCLNLIGKKRPTMKQVATELELIKTSEEGNATNAIEESDDDDDEEESEIDGIIESWDASQSYSTTGSIITGSVTLPLNASL